MSGPIFRKTLIAVLFAMLYVHGAALPQSTTTQPTEYQVKAAFLYYFVKFVEWPNGLPDPITVCVLGEDPFGAVLDRTLNGKQVNGKQLAIRRSKDLPAAGRCQILFVSSSEKDRLTDIFESLGNTPVLTVGENEDFSELGGMINFVIQGNKVQFEINVNAADHAKLKISSKLLSVAKVENY